MQLQKFCCHEKEFSLPAYKQPMRDGRHVFASNLRIAIRAEISPECESSSGPVLPTIQKLFERVEERRYLVTDWHAMPLMDRHRFGVCGFCDGHGHFIDCDHCYGEGAVIRKNQSLNSLDQIILERHVVEGESLRVIGCELGLTESRICQRLKQIRKKFENVKSS